MEKMILRIFQSEIERQAKFAIMAAQDLDNALKIREMDRIWFSVQGFLVATGNISKLLWPSEALLPERGVELRPSLSVEDDSPLEPRKFLIPHLLPSIISDPKFIIFNLLSRSVNVSFAEFPEIKEYYY